MNCKTILLTGILLVAGIFSLSAQDTSGGTSLVRTQISLGWHAYHKRQAENQAVFNGPMYMDYPFRPVQNQYVPSGDWESGQVTLGGETFTHLWLKWDASRDQLVARGYHSHEQIVVQQRALDSFRIGTHDFVHIYQPLGLYYGLYPGFFDRLYTGTSSVYAHYSKNLQSQIHTNLEYTFQERTDLYISEGGRFWRVDRKRELLALFPAYKHQIKRYWRQHHLKFSRNKALALSSWALWHDQQSH